MLGDASEFDILRKMVVVFGSLFTNTTFGRQDSNGNKQIINVPLMYSPKDKELYRALKDPDLDRPYAALLPRMSFEMVSMTYDPERKQSSTVKIYGPSQTSNSNIQYVYSPVPYNIDFKLYVYVKFAEDGTKIIEGILPYFTPDWTVKVKLIEQVNESRDVVIVLNSITPDDKYDGEYTERRVMVWELDFTVKTYFYSRLFDKPMITFVNVDLQVDNANTFDTIVITSNTITGNSIFLPIGDIIPSSIPGVRTDFSHENNSMNFNKANNSFYGGAIL